MRVEWYGIEYLDGCDWTGAIPSQSRPDGIGRIQVTRFTFNVNKALTGSRSGMVCTMLLIVTIGDDDEPEAAALTRKKQAH